MYIKLAINSHPSTFTSRSSASTKVGKNTRPFSWELCLMMSRPFGEAHLQTVSYIKELSTYAAKWAVKMELKAQGHRAQM